MSRTLERPPHQRRVLALIGAGTALSLLGENTLYTFLPHPSFANLVNLRVAEVGLLLGVSRLVQVVINPKIGSWLDTFPRRWILIAAAALGACSTFVCAVASGFAMYFAARLLWGIAWAAIWLGGQALANSFADDATIGRAGGLYQMWYYLGVGGTALAAGLLTKWFGFRLGLGISAGLGLVHVVIWILWLPKGTPRPSASLEAADSQLPGATPTVSMVLSMGILASRLIFAGVLASTAVLWVAELTMGRRPEALYPNLLLTTGLFVALRSLLTLVGSPLAGVAADRTGRKWQVLSAGLAVAGIGVWMMGSRVVWAALAGAILASLLAGVMQSLIPALLRGIVPPAAFGNRLGRLYRFGDIGQALGPPLALTMLESVSLSTVYHLFSIILFVVALLVVVAQQRSSLDSAIG